MHNFIRSNSPASEILYWEQEELEQREKERTDGSRSSRTFEGREDREMCILREQIASEMWTDYQRVLNSKENK